MDRFGRLLAISVIGMASSVLVGQLPAGAVPLTITLPGGVVVPAPPPAINTFILEGGVLPLTFTVTNPLANGAIALNAVAATNLPNPLLDQTDTVMGTNRGGTCNPGVGLAAGGNCTITLLLTTDADGIPENSDAGVSTITVSAASAATGPTSVPFNVEVDDVAEPSTLALLGLGILIAVGLRFGHRAHRQEERPVPGSL